MTAPPDTRNLRGLLFDKDGTLFDFQATWGQWAVDLVLHFADRDAHLADHLADLIRLDRHAARFHPDSPVIAGTTEEAVAALIPGLPDRSASEVQATMVALARKVAPVQAAPLAPLLERLKRAGFALGLATNDSELAAREQLSGLGLLHVFDFFAGADSGHGAKPAPGQCQAFARAVGVPAGQVAMIGDSTHDLAAGRSAGMVTVGVLSGPATRAELSPLADVVLDDIGHLPAWLGRG